MRTTYRFLVKLCGITAALAYTSFSPVCANTYTLPGDKNAVIGDVSYISAWGGETLLGIAQRNNIGLNAMLNANPGFADNARLASGTHVKVPSKFMLPPLPRKGIIVNVAEMRMYYYPEGTAQLSRIAAQHPDRYAREAAEEMLERRSYERNVE